MEYKAIVSQVKEIQDRTVTGITAVFGNVDDGADRLFPGAFTKTLQERLGRVQHLWQHDASQPPIAKIDDAHEVGVADLPLDLLNRYPNVTGGLQVTRTYLATDRAEEVLRGIQANAISEMSFGYDAVKYDYEEVNMDGFHGIVRNLREVRLWDTSDVNWGMNSATVASKQVDKYLEFAHHDENGAVDQEKTMAAMLKLMTGKVLLVSEDERKHVYDHLAEHYARFKAEVPDFDVVELVYMTSTFQADEAKTGRVLSSANLERLKRALAELQEVLTTAEPLEDPDKAKTLTADVLRRLQIASRDPIIAL